MSRQVRKALVIGREPGGGDGGLESLLGAAAIETIVIADGAGGLRAFYAERPDVILLDLDLVDVDAFALLATVRELSELPVLAVAAADGDEIRIRVLRAGADDCVVETASAEEVAARVEALLRRARPGRQQGAVIDDEFIRIDHPRHRVEVLGVEVALTPIEFRMLACFVENPGRVLGHGQLLDMVWGDRIRDRDEVKLYVSYLRRKLGAAASVDPVETVRGVGYHYRPRRTDAE